MQKDKRRSLISEAWEPSEKDVAYATAKGVDATKLVEPFRDFHLARGSLMLDWAAAWRTWCRNEIAFGYPNKSKLTASLNGSDAYGADAWVMTLGDLVPGTMPDGSVVPTLAGYDVAGVARDVCAAAGLPQEWRGDLSAVADWLRLGVEPDRMLAIVRRSAGPRRAGNWRYYDKAMQEAAKAEPYRSLWDVATEGKQS